jgi:hypothetical protein
MQYDGLAWVVALVALLALVVAARILSDRHWFLGWLRGTAGLLFVAVAGLVDYWWPGTCAATTRCRQSARWRH